jgi:hypothetical protein
VIDVVSEAQDCTIHGQAEKEPRRAGATRLVHTHDVSGGVVGEQRFDVELHQVAVANQTVSWSTAPWCSTSQRDATSNELRGSTQPASPFARMRRQEPRDSPNSTRELGPIDATIRECRLASARITTQCRE